MVLFGTHRVICTQCLMHCLNDVYLNVEISIPIYLFIYFILMDAQLSEPF